MSKNGPEPPPHGPNTNMKEVIKEFLDEFGVKSSGGGGGGGGDSSSGRSGALGHSLRYMENQISRYLSSHRPIFSDSNDTRYFLDAVDTLIGTIHGLDPVVPGDSRILDFAQDILQRCMSRLAHEFNYLMDLANAGGVSPMGPFSGSLPPYDVENEEEEQYPVAPPFDNNYNVIIEAFSWGTISDLQNIARRMVEANHSRECARVYIRSRRCFLEESLARVGLLAWTPSEVHAAPWNDLDGEIKRWVRGSKIAFLILFPSEHLACSRVFRDLGGAISNVVFAEVCRVAVNKLLGFADSVASSSRSPERLFSFIDLYEALRGLLPEIESVFSDPYSAFVAEESSGVLHKLGDAICGVFTELENLIRRDPTSPPVSRGDVHPITRYVMNYLLAASASWRTLEEVMGEERDGSTVPSSSDHALPNSSLSTRVVWMLSMLLKNLDAKAVAYRDDAGPRNFFLLNNGSYILKKASTGELVELLGESWIRGQVARVRQWRDGYLKHTWGRLVEVLRTDDVRFGTGDETTVALQEKVTRFNLEMASVHETQAGWMVANEELRDELIQAALDAVVPKYMTLLASFRGKGREVTRRMDRLVRYGEADVQRMIRELYQRPRAGDHYYVDRRV